VDKTAAGTRLAINLKEGTIEVEGNEEFVRFVYQDFKESLSKQIVAHATPISPIGHAALQPLIVDEDARAKPRSARKVYSGGADKARKTKYKPQFNSKLDLSGLPKFYEAWDAANNYEKILVFAMFLRDRLQVVPCSADDIYTCFFTLKHKGPIPEAFVQTFHDAKSRTHYIEYDSIQSISITIPGENRYNEKLKANPDAAK